MTMKSERFADVIPLKVLSFLCESVYLIFFIESSSRSPCFPRLSFFFSSATHIKVNDLSTNFNNLDVCVDLEVVYIFRYLLKLLFT